MTRSSLFRRARIGFVAALAIAVGALVPVISPPEPAAAAYGAMIQPVSGNVTGVLSNRCDSTDDDHFGIDIAGNSGTSIKAAYSGTVASAGPNGGYGNFVEITHPGGYTTRYAHMNATPLVTAGAQVSKGQVIGYVGNTGNSFGVHLHFEVYRNGVNIGGQLDYTCGERIAQGTPIPWGFPGLGGSSNFDLNGDAKADLLAIRNDGYLVEFFGNGGGGTTSTYVVGPGWDSSTAIVHGDYNGDGAGDLLQTRTDGSLYLYAGNYASGFTPTLIGSGWAGFSLLTGGVDFTGDGHPDLVGRAADANLYAYPGNGQGGFGNPIQIGTNWSAFTALVAGDFNGDGRGDLAARNSAGELWGYYGTANGLGLVQQIGTNWNGFSTITGGADYNSDGKADLMARNGASQTLWLYLGTGNGGFGNGIQVGQGWGAFTLIS
jgi:hypothetical protein